VCSLGQKGRAKSFLAKARGKIKERTVEEKHLQLEGCAKSTLHIPGRPLPPKTSPDAEKIRAILKKIDRPKK